MSQECCGNTVPLLPFKGHNEYPPDHEGRKRYVRWTWVRDPDGKFLPKPGPCGVRPPNQILWGHSLDEFFYINRLPGPEHVIRTCWTRSMLKEWGEGYDPKMWSSSEAASKPHFRKPWPVLKLKLPKDEIASDYYFDDDIPDFGFVHHGCPDSKFGRWQFFDIRKDDPDESLLVQNADESELSDHLSIPDDGSASHTDDSRMEVDETSEELAETADKTGASGDDPNKMDEDQDCKDDVLRPHIVLNYNDTKAVLAPDLPAILSEGAERHKRRRYKLQGRTLELRSFRPKYTFSPYSMPAPDVPPPRESEFSVEGVPKLEERIPDAFFPDFLMVHDPHSVTYVSGKDATLDQLPEVVPEPRKYRRVYPKLAKDELLPKLDVCKDRETVAHLYLHQKNRLGVGHHSFVYRAPLELPPPLSARSRNGRVSVAAKVAVNNTYDRKMLAREAEVYSQMPSHMSQEWCGFNFVAPLPHPVPVGPVIPKLYGYYEPIPINGYSSSSRSPIILMEECGSPIEPEKLDVDQRSECFSLMYRIHLEGWVQNSFYIRNILMQPGPLTAAPEERSMKTPSFRVIDFGRGETVDEKDKGPYGWRALEMAMRDEEKLARRELGLGEYDW